MKKHQRLTKFCCLNSRNCAANSFDCAPNSFDCSANSSPVTFFQERIFSSPKSQPIRNKMNYEQTPWTYFVMLFHPNEDNSQQDRHQSNPEDHEGDEKIFLPRRSWSYCFMITWIRLWINNRLIDFFCIQFRHVLGGRPLIYLSSKERTLLI